MTDGIVLYNDIFRVIKPQVTRDQLLCFASFSLADYGNASEYTKWHWKFQ